MEIYRFEVFPVHRMSGHHRTEVFGRGRVPGFERVFSHIPQISPNHSRVGDYFTIERVFSHIPQISLNHSRVGDYFTTTSLKHYVRTVPTNSTR